MMIRRTNVGFTLIEFIIYIGLSAMVLVALMRVMLAITGTREKTEVRSILQQEVRFAMDRMEAHVKSATSINEGSSTFNSPDGVLSLQVNSLTENPTVFRKVGSGITIQLGLTPQVTLTSEEIEVEELRFTNLTATNTYGTVRIRLQAKDAKESEAETYTDSLVIQSSISLRQ